MRLAILAFACGIALLQMQGELPDPHALGGFAALALSGLFLFSRRTVWFSRLLTATCCTVLGFAFAGVMVQQRLADQLPEEWEVKDIRVTGVIASLPQRFERGERFEFDVESVETEDASVPGRIMLSWYRSWDDLDDTECA